MLPANGAFLTMARQKVARSQSIMVRARRHGGGVVMLALGHALTHPEHHPIDQSLT